MKFKVGDTIKIPARFDAIDTITEIVNGFISTKKYNHCLSPSEIAECTLVGKFTPPFWVDCPNSSIWERVINKSIEMGYSKKGDFIHEWHDRYFVQITTNGINTFAGECEKQGEHITYLEFLNVDASTTTAQDIPKDTLTYDSIEKECRRILSEGSPIDYCSFDYGKSLVDAVELLKETRNNNKSLLQKIMAELKEIPNRLKKVLDKDLGAFYKLGWIDGDLDVTEDGEEELKDFLFDNFTTELGEIARKKIADMKKQSKKEEE